MVLDDGIEKTRINFNEILKPSPISLILIIRALVLTKKFKAILKVARNFYRRNDNSIFIIVILVIIAVPYSIVYALLRNFLIIYRKSRQST
jgi:hypothetical protein